MSTQLVIANNNPGWILIDAERGSGSCRALTELPVELTQPLEHK